MRRTVLLRLAALVVALAAIVGVALVAYHFGVTNASGDTVTRVMPIRGRMVGFGGGGGFESGFGLFGFVSLVVVGLLFFWLLAALVSPNRGGAKPMDPATGDLDQLGRLSQMHDAGKLTDEEFTTAKRKLLGLQ
jgi:hypothetical protein